MIQHDEQLSNDEDLIPFAQDATQALNDVVPTMTQIAEIIRQRTSKTIKNIEAKRMDSIRRHIKASPAH